MQAFTIDTSAWTEFWARWEDAIRQIPGLKEQILEKAGEDIRDAVRQSIDRSGLNDQRGRVKTWQNPHIGSGKGYVAVRSDSVEVESGGGGKGKLNAGALTNYLTSGHKVRGPSGRAKRYVPRARMTKVPGLGFYKNAAGDADQIAVQAAEEFLEQISEVIQQ